MDFEDGQELPEIKVKSAKSTKPVSVDDFVVVEKTASDSSYVRFESKYSKWAAQRSKNPHKYSFPLHKERKVEPIASSPKQNDSDLGRQLAELVSSLAY